MHITPNFITEPGFCGLPSVHVWRAVDWLGDSFSNMHTKTLPKRFSPLTNNVGIGKINRSVTLTDQADAILPQIAAELGFRSVNEFIRHSIEYCAEQKHSVRANALKVAMRAAMFFFVATLPLCALPARRPSRNGMMARTAAHAVRKTEVGAV